MKEKTRQVIYPNLEEKLWEAHISTDDVAKLLNFHGRQSIYPKLHGDVGWSLDQMMIIKKELEKKLKRKFTLDYLFKKEDSPNG